MILPWPPPQALGLMLALHAGGASHLLGAFLARPIPPGYPPNGPPNGPPPDPPPDPPTDPSPGHTQAGLCFCSLHGFHHGHWHHQVKRVQTWLVRLFFAATVGFSVWALR